jgi:hypothetical protein
MKRLAMVLAVAFTMGLAASTVTASTVKDEKAKKETKETKKSCCSEGKTCCAKDKKAEAPKK